MADERGLGEFEALVADAIDAPARGIPAGAGRGRRWSSPISGPSTTPTASTSATASRAEGYEDRIVIYRDTLERDFGHDRELLARQVERTLRHELAHHLGWDERGVGGLGL